MAQDKSLEDIWNELLQLHWEYLETEENMQKIEMRKKLEGDLRDFLSIVQHDRKFFLTETAHVLKQSIMKMPDFTAYKALIGFEAIAQYANNLFRKPWRKEYRTIKMYSGYYQHEVKANLYDAEKLFEAMGYTLMPNQTLVLDGPICPDQVTNVSRDAMTAYVECQIMKQIYHGLTAMQLTSTWKDIFKYRELYVGSASQSIKAIAFVIQERRYKTEKQPAQSQENYPPTVSNQIVCNASCTAHHQHMQPVPLNTCNHQHISQISATGGVNTNSCLPNNVCINKIMYANGGQGLHMATNYPNYSTHPAIPHSKSLEHYPEQNLINLNAHSRHSFDHPACDYGQRANDCVDGMGNYRQNCAIDHPYKNVSGNRYPLPPNISNLSQVDPYAGEVPPPPPPPHRHHSCAIATNYEPITVPPNFRGSETATTVSNMYANGCIHPQMPGGNGCCHQNMYYDCNHRPLVAGMGELNGACAKYYSSVAPSSVLNHNRNGTRTTATMPMNDHLIDFDAIDKTSAPKYGHSNRGDIKQKSNEQLMTKQLKYLQPAAHNGDEIDGGDSRKSNAPKKFNRNAELLAEYEDHLLKHESPNSRASDFDSFDSSNNLSTEHGTDRSTANKIRDGVGCYETWDYVFQNIGKSGYNKQPIETNDLTVQGLDLDSLAIASTNEKRRSRNVNPSIASALNAAVTKKLPTDGKAITRREPTTNGTEKAFKTNSRTTSKSPTARETNGLPHKSALKTTDAGLSNNGARNGVLDEYIIIGNRAKSGTIKKITTKSSTPSSSNEQNIRTMPKMNGKSSTGDMARNSTIEWPCKHCTFLNPTTTNICQMCFKTKDFMPDGPKASTCV